MSHARLHALSPGLHGAEEPSPRAELVIVLLPDEGPSVTPSLLRTTVSGRPS
jgi:hypothetical protein